MKLARTKSDPQIYTVISDAAGPGFSFPVNALVEITPPIPPRLLPHIARVERGNVLPGKRVLEIDGAAFEQHVADEERRQSQPAPTADRMLSRDEIVRELFHGHEGAFEAADVLAFPRSSGRRIEARRIVALWRARDLDQWRDRIIATAAALGR